MVNLRDFYVDYINSLIVQGCDDVKVIIDCPTLQRASRLQHLTIRTVRKLEFAFNNALHQTPAELTIENVNEIISLPTGMIKSPNNNSERKCLGNIPLKALRVRNSKINNIETKAIYNVIGMKTIEFTNVTVTRIQNQGIEAVMGNDKSTFSLTNCKINTLDVGSIAVQANTTSIISNTFPDLNFNAVNITSERLQIRDNVFAIIKASAFTIKSSIVDISSNSINTLERNAFANVKCKEMQARRRFSKRQFYFTNNIILNLEPNSLLFDYDTCKNTTTLVDFSNNRIDCSCQNIAFLYTKESDVNSEFKNLIINIKSNNTCLAAPCFLPVEIVKTLVDNNICGLNLNLEVKCLLYNDEKSKKEKSITDEETTEAEPTFYLIRQADRDGDAIAAMTAIDKDNLLHESQLNMTNRTTIRIVFDSSRDFVENLRSTSTSRQSQKKVNNMNNSREYSGSRCRGNNCQNSVAYNKQKALDFYKYIYAQLRPPPTNSHQNNN